MILIMEESIHNSILNVIVSSRNTNPGLVGTKLGKFGTHSLNSKIGAIA